MDLFKGMDINAALFIGPYTDLRERMQHCL